MAKIQEEVIVVKLSKLVKNNKDNTSSMITDDVKSAIEQVVEELVGENVIVEVEVA